jgi:hypothetical protein
MHMHALVPRRAKTGRARASRPAAHAGARGGARGGGRASRLAWLVAMMPQTGQKCCAARLTLPPLVASVRNARGSLSLVPPLPGSLP